ncbi:MAG: leucine-rich repeat protein [Treponema sp.]|nr:leucine-rich repeat protein [Treponema sp.]
MKKYFYGLLLVLPLIFGCSDPFQNSLLPNPDSGEIPSGMGRVIIGQEGSRTILPDTPEFVSYVLEFEYQGEDEESKDNQTATSLPCAVDLTPGSWLIAVTAYTRIEDVDGLTDGDYPAAEGSTTVTVSSGESISVTVDLSSGTAMPGEGVLEYDIGLPDVTVSAELRILNMADKSTEVSKDLMETASGSIALNAGYYLLQVQVNTGRIRSKTELIHIYSGHTTRAAGSSWNFNTEEGVYLSLSELEEILDAAPANTTDTPYTVKLNVDLQSLATSSWKNYHTIYAVLGALYNALHGKYINLDLSGATGSFTSYPGYSYDNEYYYSSTPEFGKTLVSVVLPEDITGIFPYTFSGCSSLKTIVFPQSLQTIGSYSFQGCSSLEELELPDSLQTIGASAFEGCTDLYSDIACLDLSVYPNLLSIGDNAYKNCVQFTSLKLPPSLKTLGAAFSGCTGLMSGVTSIDLLACSALETIGASAFEGWTVLKITAFPSSLKNIGNSAFKGCALGTIALPAAVETIGASAFEGCTVLKITAFPSSLKNIGDGAFKGCTLFGTIALPAAVETIGASAFEGCTGLVLNIPSNSALQRIGAGAFKDCTFYRTAMDFSGLKFLTSIDLSGYTELETLNLSGCIRLPSINVNGFATLKQLNLSGCNQLKTIAASNAASLEQLDLSGCTALTSINMENAAALEQINLSGCTALTGNNINLSGCTALTTVTLSPSTGTIPAAAFSGCTSLDSLYFAGSQATESFNLSALDWLKSADLSACTGPIVIGANAFANCAALETVVLPASLTAIGNSAFEGCTSLYSNITCLDLSVYPNLLSIGDNAYKNCAQFTSLVLPSSLKTLGAAFSGCTGLMTGLTGLDLLAACPALETIGNDAFRDFTSLAAVSFPKSVKTIGGYAFSNTALTSVDLSDCTALTSIGVAAFPSVSIVSLDLSGCAALASIDTIAVSNSDVLASVDLSGCTALTSIGNNAFSQCTALTSVDLSGSTALTSIGANAFTMCDELAAVSFPKSLETIGDGAFSGCIALTSVDFSGCTALTSIGASAFRMCNELAAVSFPKSLETIGYRAFQGCTVLTSVDFSGCIALTSISIVGAPSIPADGAFQGCTVLTSVDFSGCTALTNIGYYAFSQCTALASLDLSDCTALTRIGYYAFRRCTALTSVDFSGCTALISIGNMAFDQCTALTSVDFSGCTALIIIGGFRYSALTSVDLSPCAALETFGSELSLPSDGPFSYSSTLVSVDLSGCAVLKNMYHITNSPALALLDLSGTPVPPRLPVSTEYTFPASLVIYVPAESVDAYKAASGWSDYASQIQAKP